MSELWQWCRFLAVAAIGLYFFTEATRLTCPHLTRRQRWELVAYLLATASLFHGAWRLA